MIDWLEISYETLFALDAHGRIVSENDPPASPGPLFWIGGTGETNLHGARFDLADATAERLQRLAASEPPLLVDRACDWSAYLAVLGAADHPLRVSQSLTYALPHGCAVPGGLDLVAGDSQRGRQLFAEWTAEGVPDGIAALGHATTDDIWGPWCIALRGGEVAAIAFAARLGRRGAELGVATRPEFRGQGLAAAVTALWTHQPALAGRMLFYGTDIGNISSQSVARRLGLPLIGRSMRISLDL